MFTRKKKKIEVPTIETRTVTVPTAQGIKDMITPAVASAAALAKDYTHEASDWAKPRLEQGRAIAEKQASQAKDLVGDNAKLSELIAAGSAARGEAARRSHDAALVLRGDATIKKVKHKKGGGIGKLFLNLGVLTVLGALAAVVAQKLQQPKDDPWARPLTDPYVAPATGRDATVAGGEGVEVTEVDETADITPAAGQVPTATDTTTFRTPGDVRNEGENRA